MVGPVQLHSVFGNGSATECDSGTALTDRSDGSIRVDSLLQQTETAGDESSPAGLVGSAEAAADLPMIILMEKEIIAPMGIGGVAIIVAETRAPSIFPGHEN